MNKPNESNFLLPLCLPLVLFCLLLFATPASATKIPEALFKIIDTQFNSVKKRLDGVVRSQAGDLYVPLIPDKELITNEVKLVGRFPEKEPSLFIFNNGWAYVKLKKEEDKLILSIPESCPADAKKILLTKHLPADLIVPQGMSMTDDLKSLRGDLDIDIIAKKGGESEENQSQGADTTSSEVKTNLEKIFLTSPQTGKLIILDEKYEKKSEIQTDGTPGGMTVSNDKLFICDQSKNRILIVDPEEEKITGQIDLQEGTSPKGIVGLNDGKFLYVCETGANSVSALEVASKKLLIKTRVRPGPTKIEITPNGYMLLVVSGQTGEVTFISTLNQKALGYVKVGELPSDVIITKNSKAAFVSNRVSNTISIIDIVHRRVANTIKVGDGPTGIALSPDEKLLFVANAKENSIVAYKTSDYTRAKDTQLPLDVEFPGKIVFLPGTTNLLVTSAATDTIGILDTDTMKFIEQPRIGCTSDNAICINK